MSPEAVRLRLLRAGFCPTPCAGNISGTQGLETQHEPTPADFEWWSRTAPSATNTGVLTRTTPAFDIDILDPKAAEAVEGLARERFEERGFVLVRFGNAPKRAIPFRTEAPFPKIVAQLVAVDGATARLELLADGQQFVAHGVHPDTGRPYFVGARRRAGRDRARGAALYRRRGGQALVRRRRQAPGGPVRLSRPSKNKQRPGNGAGEPARASR